ncbi:hypothetical protein [Leptospira bandrabouensis]|uniref:hypothetical protein n=1 Tax=Leptospira bandrabouensis TaxID=2484903 RepID=UPI001EE9A014|nr:hypothetical protein [Leptospira bandrabouensis]MCG6146492.1 hypothetical protein [Leptospira bandrabouensis]MCG6161864.1 hypothetical protein [Leptospira bandrabouensis]MCG6166085.1 hypothetical protein [Leptospira bandrabouensis]
MNKKILFTIILSFFICLGCKSGEGESPNVLIGLLALPNSSNQNTQSSVFSLNLTGAKAIGISKDSISNALKSSSSSTNAVVIDDEDNISPAFTLGDVKVEKLFTLKNNGVLVILKDSILMAEVDGKSYLKPAIYVVNDRKQYKNCKVLISDEKGNLRCLDYSIISIQQNSNYSEVNFDDEGNIFLIHQTNEGRTMINRYNVEGKNPYNVFIAEQNQFIANFQVAGDSEVLVNHISFNTGITRFDSIKNGMIKVIDSNMSNVTYYFIKKFPDGKYYYTHNIGGTNGTGIFQYNPATSMISNWNEPVVNWNNWTETYSGTNFCSAGNGYLVTNNAKVFYKAMPQSISAGSNYFVYQLYPKLQVVPVSGLVNIVSIYSIEDSNEILVAGYVSGSFDISFKFVNTNNYSARDAFPGTIPFLPEKVTVSQEKKIIEFVVGRNVKTFDFTSGNGLYSERSLEEDLIQINSF